MTRHNGVGTVCFAITLLFASSVARSAPQDNPGYTAAEYNMWLAAHLAKTPPEKLSLLDALVATFPTSVLVPYAYVDYYDTYNRQKNYPKAVEYIDKLVSMGPGRLHEAFHDTYDPNAPLLTWLLERAQAFLMGCDQPELRTPEAYAAARDAAVQGQQELSRLQRPSSMTDDQFAIMKKTLAPAFESVTRIAESGLKGDQVACKPPPIAAASDEDMLKTEKERSERYDRFIEQLKREAPRVQYEPKSR